MGILGITNRTENWKTARTFAPFFEDDSARTRLAQRLFEPLGKAEEIPLDTVKIELFWKGVRDYLKRENLKTREKSYEFRQIYSNCFGKLREEINTFCGFNDLKHCNYASEQYETQNSDKLSENIRNTEIDVVLETTDYIFIGEAKHESKLDANSNLVLVHQLIREYVTVRILIELTQCRKQVVPFVVADRRNITSLKKTDQVNFMSEKGWINKKNILSWDCIDEIADTAASKS